LALLNPDLLTEPGSPLRLAGFMARLGYGGVVLGSLRARRLLSRLDLMPGPAGSLLERTGDLYLRPILAEPQSRERAVAFLSALSIEEAAEIYAEFLGASSLPVLVCLGPMETGATDGASEWMTEDGEFRDRVVSHVLRMRAEPLRLVEREPDEIVGVLLPFLSALPS
jgi:hypothetical protein